MNKLVYALWAIAGIAFFAGIFYAAYFTVWVDSAPKPELMPQFLTWSTTIIGGVLATNFGAVLGLSISSDTSKFNEVAIFKPLQSKNKTTSNKAPESSLEKIQEIAAYAYFAGMLLALIIFAINQFESDPVKTVPLIPELSKTLIGAAVGALAIAGGNTNSR